VPPVLEAGRPVEDIAVDCACPEEHGSSSTEARSPRRGLMPARRCAELRECQAVDNPTSSRKEKGDA
jgi:hypothetical protein